MRYVRLLRIFWSNAFATELEYRLNFVSNAVLSLFWLGWAIAGMAVYFQFTESVRGWTYPELLVVVGFFFMISGIRSALITPNLAQITSYVRLGTLDFLLTKPVDSQFMVSLRHVGIYNWFDPVLGIGLAAAGVVASGRPVTAVGVASGILLVGCAVLILYALSLALMSAGIRWVSSEGVDDLMFSVVETSRLPVDLYGGAVRTLLTVIPVAFLTTVPAQAVLGRGDPAMLLIAPTVAVGSVLAASVIWRLALRSYTGASS